MTEAKMAAEPKHVFEIYIKTTPEKLWQAITDGDFTEKYYFGTRIGGELKPGGRYTYQSGDETAIEGEILEFDPPRKLAMTFKPLWGGGQKMDMDASRVTFEIEPKEAICKLRLVHDQLTPGHPANEEFFGGWSKILSGLKTLLETGETLE